MIKLQPSLAVLVFIVLLAGTSFLLIYIFNPDFKEIDSKINKIEFSSLIWDSDSTSEYRTIVIKNPDKIKSFCENLKCCSKKIMFFTDHPRESYYVKAYSKKRVYKLKICLSRSGVFYFSTIGNFENTGLGRKYLNSRIGDFINSSVEPLFYSNQ
jgi:hypothetical protein